MLELSALEGKDIGMPSHGTARPLNGGALLRPISGGSNAAAIAVMIRDTSLCIECIAKRTGIPSLRIDILLNLLGATVAVDVGPRRCEAC